MSKQHSDLTQPPNLSVKSGLTAIRTKRPIYHDLMPPCNHACPAGENIQAWMALASEGKYRDAFDVLVRDNPLPAVHGRVCYHPCESHCNRTDIDEPVSIHAVERFLGDLALAESWTPVIMAKPSGKRILIIGAGPSGLSCAFHLAMMGHTVEIHEAGPVAGGMLHFGIPSYRLPRNILRGEIERIERIGVKIVLNHKVDNVLEEKIQGRFDAVFVAVGAHLAKRVDIPAQTAGKMLDAVSFLKDVELGNAPKLGRRVAIYGGGNTAMDAARVAMRLGAEPLIIYRRDREHMAAHDFEAEEALQEGVKIHWLRTIRSIDEKTLQVEVMKLDAHGKPVPTGEIETLEADDLILALGQDTDTGFLKKVPGVEVENDGVVKVDNRMMTGCEGLFAGGDMVPSERTVTIAVGHGKKAARNIDAWFRGTVYSKVEPRELATVNQLSLWFYAETEKRTQAEREAVTRKEDFLEVRHGLSESEANYEAKRCLSCGNCFECDGCYGVCPEGAIIKLGTDKRYEIDYEKCTGCLACFDQCPCHALSVVPEPEAVH